MILAVASGKGGTGKTTVAVNLALCSPRPVRLLDCDVEEPNCHIFLKPIIRERETVHLLTPSVDESTCNACGECARLCQYHAILPLGKRVMVFPELCHGCGGCAKVCPTGAIREVEREIGVVEIGAAGGVAFVQGTLAIGQPTAPPVIRAVKHHTAYDRLNIVDCAPGTSCPVVTAVRGSDYVLLVTEPTPFGLHDLKLAAETVRQLGIPFGVVINRAGIGDDRVQSYCAGEGIPVLLEIPDDRRIAEAYSRGQAASDAVPELRKAFEGLVRALDKRSPGCGEGQA
jgi:MinD superfamily P-loop ATPase